MLIDKNVSGCGMKIAVKILSLVLACLLLSGQAVTAAAKQTDLQVQTQKKPALPQPAAKPQKTAAPKSQAMKTGASSAASKNNRMSNTSVVKKQPQSAVPKTVPQKSVSAKAKQVPKGSSAPGGNNALKAADTDHDGQIQLTDLAKLRQFISKKITSLD